MLPQERVINLYAFLKIRQYCEELAYPNIFCGQRRADNSERFVPVHYSDICKSELRRTDRRAAKCVENIFFKTKKLQMKINNYNTSCILAWRANMDIQFVLDVYACAMYIVSYISKAQRGISDLLRTACEEAKLGNSTVHQQVRDIGGKFLNAVEISAQEAVYIALQLPMRRSSRGSYIC